VVCVHTPLNGDPQRSEVPVPPLHHSSPTRQLRLGRRQRDYGVWREHGRCGHFQTCQQQPCVRRDVLGPRSCHTGRKALHERFGLAGDDKQPRLEVAFLCVHAHTIPLRPNVGCQVCPDLGPKTVQAAYLTLRAVVVRLFAPGGQLPRPLKAGFSLTD
jgi:hypothetical protein